MDTSYFNKVCQRILRLEESGDVEIKRKKLPTIWNGLNGDQLTDDLKYFIDEIGFCVIKISKNVFIELIEISPEDDFFPEDKMFVFASNQNNEIFYYDFESNPIVIKSWSKENKLEYKNIFELIEWQFLSYGW